MDQPAEDAARNGESPDPGRRRLLGAGATVAMFAGLGASYGSLAIMAGKYLFTVKADKAWLFVTQAEAMQPGDSIDFESPTGVRVTVTRRAESEQGLESTANDFSALSSVCPHLGCRVHWESQNKRYFCPCHNGVFDPEGKATEGPPAAAGQELPRYPLRIEQGMVFIEMPLNALGDKRSVFLASNDVRRDDSIDSSAHA